MYIEDVVRTCMYLFSFLFISDTLHLVYWSCDHFDIHCTYSCFIYIDVCSFTYLYVCCFFSFLIHMFLIYCMRSIIFVSH